MLYEVATALAAFPNARRVVIDFSGGAFTAPGAITSRTGLDLDSDSSGMYDVPASRHCSAATDSNSTLRARSSTSSSSLPCPSDEDLLCEALSALRGRNISSLALLHLSCPPPPPSALAHLRPTLLELELSDTSYARAVDQGAFNLLVKERGEICARSDELVRLALSLPQLRRLSLSSAAFSVGGLAALAALTRLESLSIVGCVECPGAAPQAAETYRSLLRVLRSLRELRLPMAVASSSTALLDDDDDDDDEDINGGNAAAADDNGGDNVFGREGGRGGGGVGGDFFSGFFGGQNRHPQRHHQQHQHQQHQHRAIDSWRSSTREILGAGRGVLPGGHHVHVEADPWVAVPPAFPPGPALGRTAPASTNPVAATTSLPTQHHHHHHHHHQQQGQPLACPGKLATAAVGDLVRPAARSRQQHLNQLAAGFVFPPNLRDLTIPLSSCNRPVFEAACAAFSSGVVANGERRWAAASSAVCGSPPSAPDHPGRGSGRGIGMDTPAGGFGAACGTTAAQRVCACSGTIRNHPGSCFAHAPGSAAQPPTTAAGCAASRSATRCCGAGAGGGGLSLRSLHIPTLAGYSHWEGSFLASARDFEMLSRLTGLEQLHLSLDVAAFRMSRAGMRSCFQNLLALRNLTELRITEAQQPTCFAVRKPSGGGGGHHPAGRGFGAVPASELPGPALQQLQRQWPELRTLTFFSETIVRAGGRLTVPDGIDDVDLLPPPCACCTAPYLMTAPPRSVGRWGRGEPGLVEGAPRPGSMVASDQ
ncbi:hypothetical protein PLESTF_000550100 [Pleodorina starrii]|nr:hypothetical protein PLESTF_000550100 [Pleodorina starrii]